jgi:hypothetical protein
MQVLLRHWPTTHRHMPHCARDKKMGCTRVLASSAGSPHNVPHTTQRTTHEVKSPLDVGRTRLYVDCRV